MNESAARGGTNQRSAKTGIEAMGRMDMEDIARADSDDPEQDWPRSRAIDLAGCSGGGKVGIAGGNWPGCGFNLDFRRIAETRIGSLPAGALRAFAIIEVKELSRGLLRKCEMHRLKDCQFAAVAVDGQAGMDCGNVFLQTDEKPANNSPGVRRHMVAARQAEEILLLGLQVGGAEQLRFAKENARRNTHTVYWPSKATTRSCP